MIGQNGLKLAIVVAALASAAGISGTAQATNLLTNGSFEDTTNFNANSGNDTMVLCSTPMCPYGPGSSASMPGWTVTGSQLAWIGPSNPYGLTPSDGSYFLDLTAYNNGAPFGGVSQTIMTKPGKSYQLTFDLGDNQGYNGGYDQNAITATAGSTSGTFYSPVDMSNGWTTETLNFMATGSTTVISLAGEQGWAYIGLDNVSVMSIAGGIPEPATWAMMLGGFGGLGAAMRSRRKPSGVIAA